MQLRQRIRKLVRQFVNTNGEYCGCYIKPKYEVIQLTMAEHKQRFESGKTDLEKLPDYCDKCRKPIDKRSIESTFEQFQDTVNARLSETAEQVAKRNNYEY